MKRFVSLMLVAVMASVASANLVSNGDFDDGSTDWGYGSAWGNYFYTDGSDTITSMGGWGNDGDWSNTSIWQNTGAVFQADTVYTMEVVWRSAPSEALLDSVGLVIQDATSGWVDVAATWDGPAVDNEWVTTTLVFDTATDPSVVGNEIGVSFRLTSGTGTWVHVDSVSVVPEPATLSLLGFGALAMLRKRK